MIPRPGEEESKKRSKDEPAVVENDEHAHKRIKLESSSSACATLFGPKGAVHSTLQDDSANAHTRGAKAVKPNKIAKHLVQ